MFQIGVSAPAQPQKKKKEKPTTNVKDLFREYANDSTDEETSDVNQDESNSDDGESEAGVAVTEKVFLESYNEKQHEDGQSQSKRARFASDEIPLDSSKIPFDYSVELRFEFYEFGKLVAEQLMCLSLEEARVVQAEIRALLSNVNKNKGRRITAEPTTSNVRLATNERSTAVAGTDSQKKTVMYSVTQSGSPVNVAGPSVKQSLLTPEITAGPSESQTVFSHVNIYGPSASQSGSQKIIAESSATQSVLQVNRPGSSGGKAGPSGLKAGSLETKTVSSGAKSGSSIAMTVTSGAKPGRKLGQSPAKFAVLNVKSSASLTAPVGYVVMPEATGSRFNLTTQLGNTDQSLTRFTTESTTTFGPKVTRLRPTLVISAGTITQAETSTIDETSHTFDETLTNIYDETSVKIEPEYESSSHVHVMLPSVEDDLATLVKYERDSDDDT